MKKLMVILFIGTLFSRVHDTIASPIENRIKEQSWYSEEISEKYKILNAFWQKRIVSLKQNSIDNFKKIIIVNHFPTDCLFEIKMGALFKNAIDQKINFDTFYNTLQSQPYVLIKSMNAVEQLVPDHQYQEITPHITTTDLNNIQEYMRQKGLTAAVTLGTSENIIIPDFYENKANYPFAIHSVGKVFTGVLMLIMIQNNIIPESALHHPIKLNETVLKRLPLQVRERLSKVSLHQLMTHQAGIGDYLGNYISAIENGRIPTIIKTEDFLFFIDDKLSPIGEFRYSNTSLLLVGLAIQHAYENKFKQQIDYNDILKKFIIDDVSMPSFSSWKPENGLYNHDDPIAPHIVGSPAGGYWVNSSDLAKFGKWLYLKTKSDQAFKKLLEKYGQEFYRTDQQLIVHGGGIRSSMAFLTVSIKTGGILAYASNQPPGIASDLKEMIQQHIFSTRI